MMVLLMNVRLRFALLPLLAATLAGCLSGPADPVEFVQQSNSIIIQVAQTGAPGPDGIEPHDPPSLTLYGDGRLIYRNADDSGYLESKLPDEGIQELLELGRGSGFMEFAYAQPRPDGATGERTTYLYMHSKEAANAVAAVALDKNLPEDYGKEWNQYRALQELATRLLEVDPVALGGSPPREYVADVVLLVVEPAEAPNLAGSPPAWPAPAIDLAEIAPPGAGRVERRLEGEEAALLTGWLPSIRFLYKERWFQVSYRPVFPFEENFPEFDQP